MSLAKSPYSHTFIRHDGFFATWTLCSSVDTAAAQMIPPSDDSLMIRFMFYKQTIHSFTPCPGGKVQEYWIIPGAPTKAITVRPSEFSDHSTARTIVQTPSGRLMMDFINAHFPPGDGQCFVPQLVAKIIRLVRSSIQSEAKGFIDVRRRLSMEVLHHLKDDEATRASMKGYFEATRRGTCAICMDDYEIKRDDAIRLRCLHVFHGSCISKWLMIKRQCPVCCHPFGRPELKPWFNPPVQEGILMSHSRI